MTYILTIYEEAKGQPRPRAFVRGGRGAVYDPCTANNYKHAIVLEARRLEYADMCLDTPVCVYIDVFVKRPKSHFRANGEVKPLAPALHTQKPDADNIAKAVLDALTTAGVLRDDKCVYGLTIRKYWAGGDATHRTEITIRADEDK